MPPIFIYLSAADALAMSVTVNSATGLTVLALAEMVAVIVLVVAALGRATVFSESRYSPLRRLCAIPAVRHGREGDQPYPAPRIVGPDRNAVDCGPEGGRGCLLAVLRQHEQTTKTERGVEGVG
jgi:hypothetical protein